MIQKKSLKRLFLKIEKGNLNDTDKKQLKRYIENSYNDQELNSLMKKHWDRLSQNTINSVNENSSKEKPNSSYKHAHKTIRRNYRQIAAIAIFIISIAGLFYASNSISQNLRIVTVETHAGENKHLFLPDSSEIWLNASSKIVYRKNINNRNTRNVELTGEAFFKVKHDVQHPFIVKAREIQVKVLGTSFNVSNYSNDNFVATTLEEGSISLLNTKGKQINKLVPGTQATYNIQTKKIFITKKEQGIASSWKNGKLIFREEPLASVAKKLERKYNCTIKIDESLKQKVISYNAVITNESLEQVLTLIKLSTNVETTQNNTEIIISDKQSFN